MIVRPLADAVERILLLRGRLVGLILVGLENSGGPGTWRTTNGDSRDTDRGGRTRGWDSNHRTCARLLHNSLFHGL